MNVQHFEKGLSFSDTDLVAVARKIGKIATYCRRVKDEASVVRVESERRNTKKEKDQVKVMVTVMLPKKILRAESRRVSPLEALDRCIEKIEPQIKRYKEQFMGRERARRTKDGRRSRDLAA